jgi:hypothetical protein
MEGGNRPLAEVVAHQAAEGDEHIRIEPPRIDQGPAENTEENRPLGAEGDASVERQAAEGDEQFGIERPEPVLKGDEYDVRAFNGILALFTCLAMLLVIKTMAGDEWLSTLYRLAIA